MHSLDAMKISHFLKQEKIWYFIKVLYFSLIHVFQIPLWNLRGTVSGLRALLWKKKLSIIYTRHGRCFFMWPNRQLIYVDLNPSCFNNKKLDVFKSMDDRKELSITLQRWSYFQWAEHLHEITFCSIYMDVHKPLASSQTTLIFTMITISSLDHIIQSEE